jgi:tRNA dimethylallyltransferase
MEIPAMPEPRAIALAGPTASGKSSAALALAQEHGAEIISVDSALVYRGMDIGTAKPTSAELEAVPHHLIDIRDPLQAYSAAEFAADAARLVGEINARGKPALLVGGTMLYFKALFEGLDAMPAADPEVRAELDAQAARDGWASLHEELSRVDPVTAARLAPGDTQRIQRALEVYRVSGQPLSSFHKRDAAANASPLSRTPLFSLEPMDRAWLHQRIAQRFDTMLASSFIDEVKALRARGDLSPGLPSMRCVGYRQAWEMLDGAFPASELRNRGIAATRQLAKRQLTWLRGMPRRVVIACDAPDAFDRLRHAVGAAL